VVQKNMKKNVFGKVKFLGGQLNDFFSNKKWVGDAKSYAKKQKKEIQKIFAADVKKMQSFLKQEKKELERFSKEFPKQVKKIKAFVDQQKKEVSGIISTFKKGKSSKSGSTKKKGVSKKKNARKKSDSKVEAPAQNSI
jgi:hypothetical protein